MKEQWIQVVGVLVPLLVGVFAYRQATKATKIQADTTDRGKLTDDLQEEVAALRSVMRETRQDADHLRVKLRSAMTYLELCMRTMRNSGIEPPPVPELIRYPWEEGPDVPTR